MAPKRPNRKYKKRRTNRKRYNKKYPMYRKVSTTKFNFRARATFTSLTIPASSGALTLSVYSPSFGNIDNYLEYAALFDEYKINALKFSFVPNIDMNNVQANQRFSFYTVIDNNDDNNLASVSDAEDYRTCKRTISTKTHNRYFKPKCSTLQTDINGNTFLKTEKPGWISTLDVNAAHGYLKWISELNPNSSSHVYDVYCIIYFSCRNVK